MILRLTVGLIVLSVLFWVLERWRPAVRVTRRAIDTRVDVGYWFFTPLITRAVTRVAVGLTFVLVAWSQGVTLADLQRLATSRQTWASNLPVAVQIPLILLVGDLLAYWTHRWFHGRWLWRFHAIHHSSKSVDWLSSVRLHPVNDAVARVAQVLPMYWMGFNGAVLAAFVPFLTFYALLLHANLKWSYGRLGYILASPVFHRWHHTSEAEGLDKNFAGLFPFIDALFGTLYLPRGRQPERFGLVDDDVPDGLLGQLAYPFRKRSPSR